MNQETSNQTATWKDYVFSWPVYIAVGICLMELARRTAIYQGLEDKIFKVKE